MISIGSFISQSLLVFPSEGLVIVFSNADFLALTFRYLERRGAQVLKVEKQNIMKVIIK